MIGCFVFSAFFDVLAKGTSKLKIRKSGPPDLLNDALANSRKTILE